MKQLVLLFLVFYGIERILETFWKRKKINGRIVAPYTLHLLVGTYVLMYLDLFWESLSWETRQISSWITVAGLVMVLISIIGRNSSIKTLGKYHSIHIEIRDNHELVQSGPYRFIRNPYYLSNMVEAIGLPLTANAWSAMLISIFLYVPLLVFRMVLEERALEEKFGDAFVAYKEHVPRVIPKLP